jgi:hypothetical protein
MEAERFEDSLGGEFNEEKCLHHDCFSYIIFENENPHKASDEDSQWVKHKYCHPCFQQLIPNSTSEYHVFKDGMKLPNSLRVIKKPLKLKSYYVSCHEKECSFNYQYELHHKIFVKSIIKTEEIYYYRETFCFTTYHFYVEVELGEINDEITKDFVKHYKETIDYLENTCCLQYIDNNKSFTLISPNDDLKELSQQLYELYIKYYDKIKELKDKSSLVILKSKNEYICQNEGHSIFEGSSEILCLNCQLRYQCRSCRYMICHEDYRNSHNILVDYITEKCPDCKNKISTTCCKTCKSISCDCGCPCGCCC